MNTWQTKKLGDIAEISGGGTPPTGNAEYFSGDIPWFTPSEITSGTVSVLNNSQRQITEEAMRFTKVAEQGTVLLSSRATIGNIGIVSSRSTYNQGIKGITPKEELNPWYLAYWLLANKKKLEKSSYGTTFKELSATALKRFDITVPPFSTQQQIVEKLDAIRKLQELNNKEIEKVEELFKSWLARNFKSRSDWQETELKNVCTVTSSKRIYASEYVKQGIPFFRSKEIVELANNREIQTELFISPERFNELRVKFGSPKPGDILLTAIGTIGEIYIVKIPMKFYFKDGNVLWLKDFKGVHPSFIKLALQIVINRLKRASSGSAYKALTIDNLKKIIISFPTLIEQKQIVEEFELIESIKVTFEQQKQLLNELFESLLNRAMKGELVN